MLIFDSNRCLGQMSSAPVDNDLRPARHFNNEALPVSKRIYR